MSHLSSRGEAAERRVASGRWDGRRWLCDSVVISRLDADVAPLTMSKVLTGWAEELEDKFGTRRSATLCAAQISRTKVRVPMDWQPCLRSLGSGHAASRDLPEDAMRPGDARRAKLMRQFALDRNELRRTSDRIEAWCALALIIAFVPLAVLAAACAVHWVHNAAKDRDKSLKQVTAVLVHAVPAGNPVVTGSGMIPAPARWTVAGSAHVGEVPAIPGSPAGTAIRIWVDAAGSIQQAPPTPGQVTAEVVVALVLGPAGVATGLWLAWCALRCLLNRRRLVSWAKEWASFGPSWTR